MKRLKSRIKIKRKTALCWSPFASAKGWDCFRGAKGDKPGNYEAELRGGGSQAAAWEPEDFFAAQGVTQNSIILRRL
jgi:hypothetical protein